MSSGQDHLEARGVWESQVDEDEGSFQIPAFLLDPLGILKRRWPWLLATLVLGLAATVIAVRLWQPSYLAEARVLITSQQIPEDFVRSTVREDSISNLTALVGEVLSRQSLGRILDQQEPYSDGRAQPGRQASRPARIGRLGANIEMAPARGLPGAGRGRGQSSLIYSLSFEHPEPIKAADVANALAARFVEASIVRRNEQARHATEFLRRELESDERELREQAQRSSEFRRAHRGTLPSELETNIRKLELLSQRHQSLINQIAEKENQIRALASGGTGQALSDNELLLQELRRQLAREAAVNTEEHPNVGALRRRVARMEELVSLEADENQHMVSVERYNRDGSRVRYSARDSVAERIRAERRALDLLKSQLAETEASITDLNDRVDRTPAIGEQLAALEQKEQILREGYLESLRKVEEARLAESLESGQQGAQVSLLDPAQPPRSPKLPRWMLLAGAVAATFALMFAVAILLELVDAVVVTARQLEGITEIPVLGSLPRIS